MTSFHNFEHSFLPTPFIKQKKLNWVRNYMCDFYDFVKFYNKPYPNLPKNFGKGNQTDK